MSTTPENNNSPDPLLSGQIDESGFVAFGSAEDLAGQEQGGGEPEPTQPISYKDIIITPGRLIRTGAGRDIFSQIDLKYYAATDQMGTIGTADIKTSLYNYAETVSSTDVPILALGGSWGNTVYAPTATWGSYSVTAISINPAAGQGTGLYFRPATGEIDAALYNRMGIAVGTSSSATITLTGYPSAAPGVAPTRGIRAIFNTDFTVDATTGTAEVSLSLQGSTSTQFNLVSSATAQNVLSTGTTTFASGDLYYSGGATFGSLKALAAGTTSQVLIGGSDPSWGAVNMSTMVSGILLVDKGGTGATTFASNGVLYGSGTSAVVGTASTVIGAVLFTATAAGVPSFTTILSGTYVLTQAVATSGTPSPILTIRTPAHTTLAANTEYTPINIDFATNNVQFARGTIAAQRYLRIQPPVIRFNSANGTTTYTATVSVEGAPFAFTNATLTESIALRVTTGAGGTQGGKGLVIVGVATQTGDYLDIKDSNTNSLLKFNSSSRLRFGNDAGAELYQSTGKLNVTGNFVVGTGLAVAGLDTSANYGIRTGNGISIEQTAVGTAAAYASILVDPGEHFNISNSEYHDVHFDLERTVTLNSGNRALMRAFRISAPTYASTTSVTVTNAATVQIDSAPLPSANTALTETAALRILTGTTTGKGVVIRGASSQTANLIDVQSSDATSIFTISNTGTATVGNNLVVQGAKELRLNNSGNTVYTALKAGTGSTSYTYTLPTLVTNGYFLQTDASGNLSWAEALSSTVPTNKGGTNSNIDGTTIVDGDLLLGDATNDRFNRITPGSTSVDATTSNASYVTLTSSASAFNLNVYAATTGDTTRANQLAAWSSGKLSTNATSFSNTDLVTKSYVDSVSSGQIILAPARVASTSNMTLSGTFIVDGITLAISDRVLVKNQTDKTQNGVYTAASSTWPRATDMNENSEIKTGMFIFVEEGTVNEDTGWALSTATPAAPGFQLGTTELEFQQTSAAGKVTVGRGLGKEGTVVYTLIDQFNTENELKLVGGGGASTTDDAYSTAYNTLSFIVGRSNTSTVDFKLYSNGTTNWYLENASNSKRLTVSESGTLTMGGYTLTLTGNLSSNGGTLTMGGNTLTLSGSLTSGAGTLAMSGYTLTQSGNLTVSSTSTLALAGNTFTISGAGGAGANTLTNNTDGFSLASGTTTVRTFTLDSGNLKFTSGSNNPTVTVPNIASSKMGVTQLSSSVAGQLLYASGAVVGEFTQAATLVYTPGTTTSGNLLLVNSAGAMSSTANLLDLQNNSSSKFSVLHDGAVTASGAVAATGFNISGNSVITSLTAASTATYGAVTLAGAGLVSVANSGNTITFSLTGTALSGTAAANQVAYFNAANTLTGTSAWTFAPVPTSGNNALVLTPDMTTSDTGSAVRIAPAYSGAQTGTSVVIAPTGTSGTLLHLIAPASYKDYTSAFQITQGTTAVFAVAPNLVGTTATNNSLVSIYAPTAVDNQRLVNIELGATSKDTDTITLLRLRAPATNYGQSTAFQVTSGSNSVFDINPSNGANLVSIVSRSIGNGRVLGITSANNLGNGSSGLYVGPNWGNNTTGTTVWVAPQTPTGTTYAGPLLMLSVPVRYASTAAAFNIQSSTTSIFNVTPTATTGFIATFAGDTITTGGILNVAGTIGGGPALRVSTAMGSDGEVFEVTSSYGTNTSGTILNLIPTVTNNFSGAMINMAPSVGGTYSGTLIVGSTPAGATGLFFDFKVSGGTSYIRGESSINSGGALVLGADTAAVSAPMAITMLAAEAVTAGRLVKYSTAGAYYVATAGASEDLSVVGVALNTTTGAGQVVKVARQGVVGVAWPGTGTAIAAGDYLIATTSGQVARSGATQPTSGYVGRAVTAYAADGAKTILMLLECGPNTGALTGTGTSYQIPIWTSSNTLANSLIYQNSNTGVTTVGISSTGTSGGTQFYNVQNIDGGTATQATGQSIFKVGGAISTTLSPLASTLNIVPTITQDAQNIAVFTITNTTGADIRAMFDGKGNLRANSKSFDIPHPTKPGKRLVYGVLEGPEHGVYHRGSVEGRGKVRVDLPEYWSALTRPGYTASITPLGNYGCYIASKDENGFEVCRAGVFGKWLPLAFEFMVIGSRRDVELDMEPDV